MREVVIGAYYRHFKGGEYRVLLVATHTETEETLVIYQSIPTKKIYARPINMFLSEVDHNKYPDINQKYRFEEHKIINDITFRGE